MDPDPFSGVLGGPTNYHFFNTRTVWTLLQLTVQCKVQIIVHVSVTKQFAASHLRQVHGFPSCQQLCVIIVDPYVGCERYAVWQKTRTRSGF
jgi:hypothetical protein